MEKKRHCFHHILSFRYACEGIITALKEEPNLKFHFLSTLLVLGAAYYFQISTLDWIIVIILIGLVLSLELTNTAIEAIVDSFTPEQHPKAKYAKDIAAAAVLIVAAVSAIAGIVIFLPHLLSYFK